MERERVAMHEAIKARFIKTPRHTIQIICGEYTHELRGGLRRGMRRAQKAGKQPQIAGRAGRAPM